MSRPHVSIVVCTHNRAAMLRDALLSLSRQQTDGRFSYEVVVVDNVSSDTTSETVEEVRNQVPNALYVYEGKKGIASARNRGVREATGEWIAFLDDDELADPRWLLELFAYAHDYKLRAVGGAVHLKLPDGCTRMLHGYVRMLLGELRFGEAFVYSLKVSPGTGNLMLHRSVFDQIGLFNEAFAVRGEDTELFDRIRKAGIEAWYVPAAIVHHVTPPQRLEPTYLFRVAAITGEGVAVREHDTHSLPIFLLRFAAKVLLQPRVVAVRQAAARWQGNAEAGFGLQCHRQFLRAYMRRGRQIAIESLSQLLPHPMRA